MFADLILNYIYDKQFVYQFIATLSTYLTIKVALFVRVRRRRHQLLKAYGIYGPEPTLLDGSLSLYRQTQTPFLLEAEWQKKYGKVFGVYVGDEPNVIITDPDLLKKIFFDKSSALKERTFIFIESPLTQGILFAKYSRWKAMRKIISPAFSTFTMRGQASTNFIEDVVQLMLGYIENKFDIQKDGGDSGPSKKVEIDIHKLTKATALRFITGLAVELPGVEVNENESHVNSLDEFLSRADSGAVIYAIRFPFLKKILEFLAAHMEHGKTLGSIRKELNKKIDIGLKMLSSPGEREEFLKQSQLIDTIIKLHHEGKLSREEVIGNAEALLFAGYETTSTTLTYIFWVIGKFPEVQEKLRAELRTHGINSKYLMQVINEVMRLYPTVLTFTSRIVSENITVNELTLPRGCKVVYNAWLMYKDPQLWPEPEKFDPERFREGAQIHVCAFAPFGLSDRKCLGVNLALLEIKTVVCELVCRYRIHTKCPDDLNLVQCATVLTKPRENIIIELEHL